MFKFLCKRCRRSKEILKEEDILDCIMNGNLEKLKKLLSVFEYDLKECMILSTKAGHLFILEYLIKQGGKNLEECLKIASENNNYNICKLLLENGAKPVAGLRYAKSPNIIKLLYRFEQNNIMIS